MFNKKDNHEALLKGLYLLLYGWQGMPTWHCIHFEFLMYNMYAKRDGKLYSSSMQSSLYYALLSSTFFSEISFSIFFLDLKKLLEKNAK